MINKENTVVKERILKEKINSYLDHFNLEVSSDDFQIIFNQCLLDLNTFLAKDPSNGGDAKIVVKCNLSYQAVLLYRIANFLYYSNHKNSAMTISEFAKLKTGIEIHPAAQIGDNFVIDHGIGTVIGETTRISRNCYILQSVILGSSSITEHRTHNRHPKTGDNVEIGAFSKILGNIRIGNNVKISPNSTITKNIEDNSRIIVSSHFQIEKNQSNVIDTGYQVIDNNLIIYFNDLNRNMLSEIQYLSKNNTFKSSILNGNSITVENNDFLSPLKLHFLKNNRIINEMIIHVQ